jgi:hypothetical protein
MFPQMATQGQGVFVASGDRGANGGVGPSLASHEAAIGLLSLADLNLLAEALDPMRKTDLAISYTPSAPKAGAQTARTPPRVSFNIRMETSTERL